jgi:peptide/nickel transport system permease protein
MTAYLIRRLIQSALIILFTSMVVFTAARFLPGDPALVYVSRDALVRASPQQLEAIRHEFGLDRPIPVQYIHWLGGVLKGDLGRSIFFRTSVRDEISKALPKTLYIGSIAFIISIVFGMPLGIIAAVRRGKWPDTVTTFLANLGITAPQFWVGILLVLVFSLYLGWLPIYGFVSPFDDLGESLQHVILPVVCLQLYPMAAVARQTRSAMLEVIRQDYIRTAWAKGLKERQIIIKHAVRNAIIPVITLIGMNVRNIFGGSVLIEKVFNIPGMGRLAVDALFSQDYAIVQGVILVTSAVVVFSNLIVDLSYGWIDPRIRQD